MAVVNELEREKNILEFEETYIDEKGATCKRILEVQLPEFKHPNTQEDSFEIGEE